MELPWRRTPVGRCRRSVIAYTSLALVLTLLPGCRTQQSTDFNRTRISGAVYDDVGQPVPGALIRISRQQAVSDTFGRFRMEGVAPGSHALEVTAPNHEPHRSSVQIQSRTQFLRVQIPSIGALVDQAITYLEESAVDAAGDIARRLESAAPEDRRTQLLLRAVSATAEQHSEGHSGLKP